MSNDRSKSIALGLVLLVVLIGGPLLWFYLNGEPTGAAFVDDPVERSTIQSSTVAVNVSPTEGAIATFTMENMAPGDEMRGRIAVTNAADTSVTYGVTSKSSESALNEFLEMVVWTGSEECNEQSLPTEKLAVGSFGTEVRDLIGSETDVDSYRTLEVGLSEVLCVQIMLPEGTVSEALGEATSQHFTISAIQQ